MQRESTIIDYASSTTDKGEALNKRSLFDVVIRGFGLWQLLYAGEDFVSFINIRLGLWRPIAEQSDAVFHHVIWHLAAGVLLLFCAGALVNVVYGADERSLSSPEEESSQDTPPA